MSYCFDTSTGDLQPLVLSYKWRIKNFCIFCKQVGDYVVSPEFLSAWSLRLYARNDDDSLKDYISIYVQHLQVSADVSATFKLSILNGREEKVREISIIRVFRGRETWGDGKFIKRSIVTDESNRILVNDQLVVQCEAYFDQTFDLVKKSLDDPAEQGSDSQYSHSEDTYFEKLFESGDFSDITFLVQGKEIRAHRYVLMTGSKVFEEKFSEKVSGKSAGKGKNVYKIGDVTYDVFYELLRFVYSDKVVNLEAIAKDLMNAANAYAIDRLKLKCEEALCVDICMDNVLERIRLADSCNATKLKSAAVGFITENMCDFVDKPEFEEIVAGLSADLICEVIRKMASGASCKQLS